MRRPCRIDGHRGGPQCLGDDLAAEEALPPRVAGGRTDERVGSVRFERQQLRERNVSDARCGHAENVVGCSGPARQRSRGDGSGMNGGRSRASRLSRTGRGVRA